MNVRSVDRANQKCYEKQEKIIQYKQQQLIKLEILKNKTEKKINNEEKGKENDANYVPKFRTRITPSTKLAEYQNMLIGKKQELINILNKAELIRNIYTGKEPLTQKLIANELQSSARILHNTTDYVYAFITSDEPKHPDCVIDSKIINSDIYPLLHPLDVFDYDAFGIDEINKLAINPKIRYLPNWNISGIRKTLIEHERLLKGKTEQSTKLFNSISLELKRTILEGIDKMFNKLSIQHRFGTFESQIVSCYFMKQVISEVEAYINLPDCVNKNSKLKRGIDTVCWQYLCAILTHYEGIPFYHQTHSSKFGTLDNTKIVILTNKPVSCCLPSVLHGLLNGIISELLCDLNSVTALIYARHLLHCSKISTYQRQLEFKDDFRLWPKLCYDKIKYVLSVLYSKDLKPLEHRVEYIDSEFWYDEDEKNKLEERVNKLPEYFKPFVIHAIQSSKDRGAIVEGKIKKHKFIKLSRELTDFEEREMLLECSANTEFLRWLTMTSTVISNFGIYNKTSLLLEYEKSVGTKVKKMIMKPEVKVSMITEQGLKIPIIHDWSKVPVLNELSTLFDSEWKSELVSEFEQIDDFEKRFVTFLTNKSGGIKSEEPTLSKELKGISNARIIAFALNRSDYHTESKFLKMLMAYGKCAIRFQIDRRARVIVIVPNAIQSSELFLLLGFNILKGNSKFNEKIAVGKQIGNILDAKSQLVSSGDVYSIKNSGDMKGMDAHTLPNLTLFLRRKMIEVLYDLDSTGKCAKYFFSEDKEYALSYDRGQYNEIFIKKLRGPVIHAAKCLYYMFSLNMYLEDNFFAKEMTVSDQTFQSGFFATSAQHTLFLTLFLLNSERKFLSNIDNRMISLFHSVMGDDVFEVISNGVKFPELVRKWLHIRNKGLIDLNYEEELSLSRMYGVFLQQAAILGVYVPYPARMSLFCDERSDTAKRHALDAIKIVLEVISAKAQRSYAIDNGISIGYAIWNQHRSSRYIYRNKDSKLISRLEDSVVNIDNLFVVDSNKTESTIRLVYPFVTVMTSPISWPMLTFVHSFSSDNVDFLSYKSKAMTSLNGDGAYLLINQMFFVSDDEHMFKFVDYVKHQKKIVELRLDSNFLKWEDRHKWGFTLGEHLLRFKRLRHLTESRKNELGIGDIEVMVHTLNKYLYPGRVVQSLSSIDLLSKHKIVVPDGLKYTNHNRSKIEQSLTVRTESLEERTDLDSVFLKHICSYRIVPTDVEILKIHALCSIRMRIYGDFEHSKTKDGLVVPSCDALLNVILPFMPGYHCNSSYGKLFNYSSLPSVHDKDVSGTLGEISGTLGASFDVDAAVEFGAYVYNINRNLVDAAGLSMGIPQKHLAKFTHLVETFISNNFNLKYHSIFLNVKYFALSGSLSAFASFGDYSSKLVRFDNINKLSKFHSVFTRDFIFAYINELNGRRIYLDYSIHSLLLIMSRGAIKYFTSHLHKLFNPLLTIDVD
jgi:hypothetical protein